MSTGAFLHVVPFIPKDRFIRIECDLKDEAGELRYPGFWFEARQSLTNGERRDLVDAIQAIDEQINELNDHNLDRADDLRDLVAGLKLRPGDAGDDWQPDTRAIRKREAEGRDLLSGHIKQVDLLSRQKWDLVMPYIRAWNLYEPGDGGDPVPVPAPADGGIGGLEAAEPDLCSWMVSMVLNAYRMGKALSSSRTSGESQEPSNAPTAAGPQIPQQNTRRSRRKS